jgi:hypothetical protein
MLPLHIAWSIGDWRRRVTGAFEEKLARKTQMYNSGAQYRPSWSLGASLTYITHEHLQSSTHQTHDYDRDLLEALPVSTCSHQLRGSYIMMMIVSGNVENANQLYPSPTYISASDHVRDKSKKKKKMLETMEYEITTFRATCNL